MLLILRGVPGCGKSTFAHQWLKEGERRARVNRDDIRMQHFGKETGVDENMVTQIEHQQVDSLLKAGYSVVVDDTNIRHAYINAFVKIAAKHGTPVAVKEFDVDLKTAIARNAVRASLGGRDVPVPVIEKMHKSLKSSGQYSRQHVANAWGQSQTVQPYIRPVGKRRAILCDLDGSLAHMNGKRGPFEWLRVDVDDVDEGVLACINAMYNAGVEVIFFSGRDSAAREKTISWLAKHGWENVILHMRAAGDMRKDNIVKYELFNEHIRDKYDVLFVIDDRWQVCHLWLNMGLKVFNVSGADRGEF